jgi:hypothetical protein
MRLKEYDVDPVDVDPDGLCESQTPAAGGVQSLALDGALIVGGVFTDAAGGRQLVITAVGNESARTFTVTGTDPDGYALTEAITGPNATTTESTEYFKTVTGITTDDDTAGAITVGTVDELATHTIPLNWRWDDGATINVDVDGTIDFTVQQTFDDVQRPGEAPRSAHQNAQWINITALAAKTADTTAISTVGATAIRLLVNSYSSGGELQMNVNQAMMR